MADEKDIAEDEVQGGGKKKLIIIIAAAVVLLLGAGAAAFFLLGGEDEDAAAGEEEVAEVVESDPVYHELDPTFVVNLPPGGPAKMLQIAIQIMTRTPTVVDTLKNNDPMIRHHVLNLLESQDSATLMTLDGKKALQQGLHDLLGEQLKSLKEPGEIQGIFFTQFVMQ